MTKSFCKKILKIWLQSWEKRVPANTELQPVQQTRTWDHRIVWYPPSRRVWSSRRSALGGVEWDPPVFQRKEGTESIFSAYLPTGSPPHYRSAKLEEEGWKDTVVFRACFLLYSLGSTQVLKFGYQLHAYDNSTELQHVAKWSQVQVN